MKRVNRKGLELMVLGGVCVLILAGCGTSGQTVITINRTPYEKLAYETTEVQKGDLEPEVILKLRAEGYEKITYDAASEELQLDTVCVSVGDRVEKGDVLVSFQSESIQEIIDTHEEQCRQNQLLLEHYTRLMQIDNTLDYSLDISQLQKEIEIASLYVEEAKEKLSRYQLIAEASGTIVEMNNYLQNGIFEPGRKLITEVCSSGNYQTERPEGYEFQVGEIYTTESEAISYELQITEITEDKIIFTPVSDMSAVSESDVLSMTIKKPVLTDVIYVNAAAVREAQGAYFVYVQNENGYREAVPVTIGTRVGEYQVITSGLSGGEKVTLN